MQRTPMAPRALCWDDVRLFLALCRCRTLDSTASLLGVEASRVASRLGRLEQALAITLFEQGGERLTLTRAAEELLPVAEEMEDGMTRLANATASPGRSRSWW